MTTPTQKLSSPDDTRERIAGRKAAEEIIEIAVGECEGRPLVFAQALWRVLQQKSIDAIGLPRRAAVEIQPLNDSQAAAFGRSVLHFGKYNGHTVSDIERSDPDYLAMLADGSPFTQQLKRYLARHKYDGAEAD